MSESLRERLRRIRGRVRRLLWLRGLSCLVAVLFGALLCAGTLDWVFRFEDRGVRLLVAGVVFGLSGWVAWRQLIRPLRHRLSDFDLALRIERRFPGLRDSLSSTVAFLDADGDARLGSPALQRRVVDETLADVDRLDIDDIVETRSLQRIVAAAIGVCFVVASVVVFQQDTAAVAVRRILLPLAETPWPKRTVLRLVDANFEAVQRVPDDPWRIARGETLELYVENLKGALPDDLELEFRVEGERVVSERLTQANLPDPAGRTRDVGVASLVVARGPMQFRAVGGDDRNMDWYEVEVVPPPAIRTIAVTVAPPAYSGRPRVRQPAGVGHIESLVGSRVELHAVVNKPLRTADLRLKDRPPVEVELAADRRSFAHEFEIVDAGTYSYWFDLTDRQGFQNPDAPRYEVRAIADAVPEVRIDRPPAEVLATPDAVLPIRAVATDDLGLTEARLVFQLAGSSESAGIVLLSVREAELPREESIEFEWELAELGVSPGAQLQFHVAATDAHDLSDAPHVGRSVARSVTIVSPREKAAELAQRQERLLDEIEAALDIESQATDRVGELRVQLRQAGELRPEDVDLLKRVELDQRQVSSRLANPVDGVEARGATLLAELDRNRIDDPEMRGRLERVVAELRLLAEGPLPQIDRDATRARKSTQIGEAGETSAALAAVESGQRTVLDSLRTLQRQLSRWRDRREIESELSELIDAQGELNRRTAEQGRKTLGRAPGELDPQERADLARVAEQQRQQGQRLERFGEKADEMARQAADAGVDDASGLREMAGDLARRGVPARMREAADSVERNDIGRAVAEQDEVLRQLNDLQDVLRNETVSDGEMLVKKLKQAEDELEELVKRQDELLNRIEAAQRNANPQERELELQRLRKEQERLRQDVESMARRLQRLQARDSSRSSARAAQRMESAGGGFDAEGDPAEGREELEEALDDLEQAQNELARERQAAEERLARELLERVADDLQAMIAREQNVIEETERLDEERRRRGNWSRAQLKSLRDLAEVQRGLADETDRLVESLEAAEVFALALAGAARSMRKAAGRLSDRKTDAITLSAERAARRRFVDLVDALDSERGENGNPPPPAGGTGDPAGPQTDGIPQLAQLKLLRTLQSDLVRRTMDLDGERRRTDTLTAEQKAELDELAAEQGRLADLARNLAQAVVDAFQAEQQDAANDASDDSEPRR